MLGLWSKVPYRAIILLLLACSSSLPVLIRTVLLFARIHCWPVCHESHDQKHDCSTACHLICMRHARACIRWVAASQYSTPQTSSSSSISPRIRVFPAWFTSLFASSLIRSLSRNDILPYNLPAHIDKHLIDIRRFPCTRFVIRYVSPALRELKCFLPRNDPIFLQI